MFRFKVSKFKNASPKTPKREHSFTNVPIGTLMQSCGNHIAASCKFTAFNCELGGGHGIGVLGLEDYGKKERTMPIIHGHADFVSDMSFSPFDDCFLATGSFDGDLKLWKIPEDGLTELLNNPALHLPSFSDRIDNVLFHPAAENILSVTSSHKVQVFELVNGKLCYEIQNEEDDQHFQSMDWKQDGSLLLTSCKDTKLRIIDPRNSSVSAECDGHPGIKDSKTVWLGNSDHVFSTGFGKSRDRTVGIWDVRSFTSPVFTQSVDNGGGTFMPFYDVDTNMLILAGKGDSLLYFFEVDEGKSKATLASSDSLDSQTIGMARVPKRALHLMQAEVNRFLQVSKNAILPISYIVPRRSYNDFYPELYPDTASGVPSMTAEQWCNGANERVALVKLDPKKTVKKPLPKTKESNVQQPSEPAAAPARKEETAVKMEHKAVVEKPKPEEPKRKTDSHLESKGEQNSPKPEHKPQAAKFHAFRVSKFKHLSGKPSKKSFNIENIKNFDQSLSHESDGLQAYNDLVAYPIAGPGGQIAVVKLSEPGRLPDTGVPVLQNPSALLDFAMDPFDNRLIAAACEDSHVRIWRVPDEGVKETMTEPAAELAGHHSKVNIVRYHPCTEGLLTTASYDLDVKLWDVHSGTELITLKGHPEPISAMNWHPDGQLFATISKDTKIRIYDPRKSSEPIQVGDGPEGPRGARIVWGGPNSDWLIVSGFAKAGARCINVYDSKDLSKLVASVELDPSPATLMLFYDEDSATVFATGKGERTLHAYEVSIDPPHLFQLTPYNGAHQHQGLVFLRKDLCDVREVEFAKAVRVTYSTMEQVSFTVPRVKKNLFQDDLFPETRVKWEPSMSCEQWMNGANIPQKRLDLRPKDMQPLHTAPQHAKGPGKYANYSSPKEQKSLQQQKEDLLSQMGDKFQQLSHKSLEQDDMEGVEDHEWDD